MAIRWFSFGVIGLSGDTKPTAPVDTLFWETDTGNIYIYNGVSWALQGASPANDIEAYPHSSTEADYSSPFAATASSEDRDVQQTTSVWGSTGTGTVSMRSGDVIRAGEEITDTALQNRHFISCVFRLAKTGTPTGAISVRIRKVSDDSIVATSTTSLDASALGAAADFTFDFADGVKTPNETFRVTCEFGGGSVGNTVDVLHTASDTYAGGNADTYIASWANFGNDFRGQTITSITLASSAIDNNTATYWQSENTVNPWLRVDCNGLDCEPSGITLHPNVASDVTQIKVQTSPDGTAWTDVRLINWTSITEGAYNYIRFNRSISKIRFIRIYGNDGGSKILAINEIKILIPTESQWNRRHGHKSISSTDATLGLSG